MNPKSQFTVFLDRDGTINVDKGYIGNPKDVELIPGAANAVKKLNDAGVRVIVVSNQSGVARGKFTMKDAEAVNSRLAELLAQGGAHLDAMYFCPHHPDDRCECRKPAPGLMKKAAAELGVDVGLSYVVGDKATDVELARNAGPGAKGIMVRTGDGMLEYMKLKTRPDLDAPDVDRAVDWILNDMETRLTPDKSGSVQ